MTPQRFSSFSVATLSPRRMAAALAALPLAAVLAFGIAAGPAEAQDIRRLGNFQDWQAYVFEEDGNKVCYMASEPKEEEGDYTQRGDVHAMVTHRPAQGTENVVSFIIGYPFKEDSRVSVNIDGKTFTLFTHKDTAWAPDTQTDGALVQSMRAGRQMIVRGTSTRGTETVDTYSLLGFTAAQKAINDACEVN